MMNKLEKLLKEHMELEFPPFSSNEQLAEWVEDLAEAEAHYIGLAQNGTIKNEDLIELESIRKNLESIKPKKESDLMIHEYCSKYFKIIERIVSAAEKN